MSERENLEQAIIAQENLRGILDDAIIDATVDALKKQLASMAVTGRAEQRKLATMLFMDTVGSTQMVRDLDPEDNLAIMDTALQRLTVPVEQYGGQVTRYMGDGFKAVFGLSAARENDPEMAVRAGLSILAAAGQYAEAIREQRGIQNFQVRVGISTGLVVIGGQSETVDATAGNAINLAARLEDNAEPGTLLISHDTYRHIRGVFDLEPHDPISARGFSNPVPVYRVLRAKERSFRSRRRGVEGIEARMVGREGELKTIQDAYHGVIKRNEIQIVTVVGEAGLGKSRLLYELENWVDLQQENLILYRGRARQETQRIPYGLLRDLFANRLEIRENDSAESVCDKLLSGFEEMLGAGEETEMKTHFVGHLLGYDFHGSPHLEPVKGEPQQIRDRSLIYLTDYFTAAAGQDPVLVLFEDLHWADDSSLDAIARSGAALAGQPLLIVGVARPGLYERRPRWFEGRAFHRRIDLHALSNRDSHHLLEELLQMVEQVPEAVRDLVVSNAEGNPFYVEELVKMLIDDGVVVKGEEQWQVREDKLPALHIPSTLTGILQARLDSLPGKERTVLQQAAVVGRIFWDAVLVHLNQSEEGLDDAAVGPGLDALRRREIIHRRDQSTFAGAIEHSFNHAILHEVAYESVLRRMRRAYHALAGEWLILNSGERTEEVAGLIADHLELAGDKGRAAGYLRRAGEQAAARFANREAVAYIGRALALSPSDKPEDRLSLLLARELIYSVQGDRDAQVQDLAESEQLVLNLGDEERLAMQTEITLRRAKYAEATSDFPEAISAAEHVIELARAAQLPHMEAAGHLHWGRALWKHSEYEAARVQLNKALALARSADAFLEEGGSLLNLGNTYAIQGDYEEAQSYYHQALSIYRKIGYQGGEGAALGNLGNTYGYQGQTEQAIGYYEQALAIARAIGERHDEGTWLGNLAVDYKNLGKIERAFDYCWQALAIAREIDDRRNEAQWLNTLGSLYQSLGRAPEAIEAHHQALDIVREIDDRRGEYQVLNYLGAIACSKGAYSEAQTHFKKALSFVRETGSREGELSILQGMGDVQLGLGDPNKAFVLFQEAMDLSKELGLSYAVVEARAGLARASLGMGDPASALKQVESILSHLETGSLEGASEPLRIYLTCYQTFKANQDRRAQEFLATVHDLLQIWASKISDEEMRRSFLHNVTTNRIIVAEYMKSRG